MLRQVFSLVSCLRSRASTGRRFCSCLPSKLAVGYGVPLSYQDYSHLELKITDKTENTLSSEYLLFEHIGLPFHLFAPVPHYPSTTLPCFGLLLAGDLRIVEHARNSLQTFYGPLEYCHRHGDVCLPLAFLKSDRTLQRRVLLDFLTSSGINYQDTHEALSGELGISSDTRAPIHHFVYHYAIHNPLIDFDDWPE